MLDLVAIIGIVPFLGKLIIVIGLFAAILVTLDWGSIIGSFLSTLAAVGIASWFVAWVVTRKLEEWKSEQDDYRYFCEVIANTAQTGSLIGGIISVIEPREKIHNWIPQPDVPPLHILAEDKFIAMLVRHQKFNLVGEVAKSRFAFQTQQLLPLYDKLSHKKISYDDADSDASKKAKIEHEWNKTRATVLQEAKKLGGKIDKRFEILNKFGEERYKNFGFEGVEITFSPPKRRQ